MAERKNKYSDFGYELLRETLLPELLGAEQDEILYWGGKLLARKYPLESLDLIPAFFSEAGWGHLHNDKKLKRHYIYELTLNEDEKKPLFSRHLEAGFLAEQTEHLIGTAAETIIEYKRKKVRFHVHVDPYNHK